MAWFTKKRVVWLAIIAAAGGYYAYKTFTAPSAAAQYITESVTNGALTVSVAGTGQVSSSNQVEIKPEVSGKIIRLNVKSGQEVPAGAVLVQLDATEAQKAVRDSQVNLESAKLAWEKLVKPADSLSLLQAANALASARDSLEKLKLSQAADEQTTTAAKQKAQDNIIKAYEDAFNAIANAFLDLPTIVGKLNDILYGYELSKSESSIGSNVNNLNGLARTLDMAFTDRINGFIAKAENDYKGARTKYDKNFTNYKDSSRYSSQAVIEALLAETLGTTKALAETAKSESNLLDVWVDYRVQMGKTSFSQVTAFQTNLSSYISQTNSHLSALLSIQRTLQDNKEAVANAERDLAEMEKNNPLDLASAEQTIKEKEGTLAQLKAGADSLDIQSQQLTIRQRQNALLDAQQKLADYTIRAPAASIVAKLNVKAGDSASSGTALATLVTKQKIAEISLNEVDVAKISINQKATLAFDAVDGLSITGVVAEIDTLGTVTQGVVSYVVKISFDTQDDRVKSGMSVSAAIITDVRQDVLVVPASAVKTQGNNHYVEIFAASVPGSLGDQPFASASAPERKTVQIGLSNDTDTEIISGLNEGDRIVVRTITPTAAAAASAPSATSLLGGGNRAVIGGGGGGFRGGN